jgi:hypothetical protein
VLVAASFEEPANMRTLSFGLLEHQRVPLILAAHDSSVLGEEGSNTTLLVVVLLEREPSTTTPRCLCVDRAKNKTSLYFASSGKL